MNQVVLDNNALLREFLETLKSVNLKLHDELNSIFEEFNKSGLDEFDEVIEEHIFALKFLEPISKIKDKEFCERVIETLYSTFDDNNNNLILSEYIKKIKSLSVESQVIEKSYFEILKLNGYPFKDCSTFLNTSISDFIISGNEKFGEIRCALAITVSNLFINFPWETILFKVSEYILENNFIPNIERPFFESTNQFQKIMGITEFDNFLIDIGVWISDDHNSLDTTPHTFVFELIPIFESESKQIMKSYKKFKKLVNSGKIELLNLERRS